MSAAYARQFHRKDRQGVLERHIEQAKDRVKDRARSGTPLGRARATGMLDGLRSILEDRRSRKLGVGKGKGKAQAKKKAADTKSAAEVQRMWNILEREAPYNDEEEEEEEGEAEELEGPPISPSRRSPSSDEDDGGGAGPSSLGGIASGSAIAV